MAARQEDFSFDPRQVSIVYSARARRLKVCLNDDGAPVVIAPFGCSEQRARQFLYDDHCRIARWLKRAIARRNAQQAAPIQWPPLDELERRLNALADRLQALAEQHRLPYRSVRFGCQKTKWGACNATRRQISLNINVIFLPTELQDYVMLHELAHLNYPHHQLTFWSFLSRLCGRDAKGLRDALKKHRLYPYRPPQAASKPPTGV